MNTLIRSGDIGCDFVLKYAGTPAAIFCNKPIVARIDDPEEGVIELCKEHKKAYYIHKGIKPGQRARKDNS